MHAKMILTSNWKSNFFYYIIFIIKIKNIKRIMDLNTMFFLKKKLNFYFDLFYLLYIIFNL